MPTKSRFVIPREVRLQRDDERGRETVVPTLLVVDENALAQTRAQLPGLAVEGVDRIQLRRPCDSSELGPERFLELLALLRDCVALGIDVVWTGERCGEIDPHHLMHLPPPTAYPCSEAVLNAWRDFSFGTCFWRNGPGFAIVRDLRPGGPPTRLTLEADTYDAFIAGSRPVCIESLSERVRAALVDLAHERLVAIHDGWFLTLPYRIVKWPIPYVAI